MSKNVNANLSSYDVIIAGGGLSGALTALSLAKISNKNNQPLSIAIVELNPILTDVSASYDDRVLALAHGSMTYLDSLDVWSLLKNDATPIEKIHISDRGFYGKARIKAKEHNVEALGYVIEMSLIGKALLKKLSLYKNVTWYCPDSINHIIWHKSHVDVRLSSEKSITAKLLLACDGGQSNCRKLANIHSSISEYNQSALIANVSTKVSHNNVAFERFTDTGPIAMLPLSKNRCSLVWTLTPEKAEEIQQLNDDEFKQALEVSFGSWLGEITYTGKRFVYPLTLVQAEQQVYHRLALVGNASHTIHPIAGQGFNLGLRDVAEIENLVKQAVNNEQDIGLFSMLNEYANKRSVDQQQVITLTDSLVTLFSNQLCPLVAGRNIGLKAMNYLPPLQSAFVQKTMGYK